MVNRERQPLRGVASTVPIWERVQNKSEAKARSTQDPMARNISSDLDEFKRQQTAKAQAERDQLDKLNRQFTGRKSA
ncbi:MAG: hypothetical protein WCT40_04615 [Candidatus Magasanikbacteria bacterium]|jgi:hypothetical protein